MPPFLRHLTAPGATGVDLVVARPDGPDADVRPFTLAADGEWRLDTALEPGARYRLRVARPGAPPRDCLDPWALAADGRVRWDEPLPWCIVPDLAFDWSGDRRPLRPWRDTVLYECHVKGMTARHPAVPLRERGTFLGLAHPAVIEHLTGLGVTAVQLLPVAHACDDAFVLARGLGNYWGYAPILPFAPDPRLATGSDGRQVAEFRQMVAALHAAGIEVILDVVFNHTGEGGPDGPALCFRALDDERWYLRDARNGRGYVDVTGCGNTLRVAHPSVRAYVLDALRHWMREMRVDGFRFDLAPAMLRTESVETLATDLLTAIAADPLLSRAKLIAEPWDLGPDGYCVGRFPWPWRETNDRFRDDVRRAWLHDGGLLPALGRRLDASPDLYSAERRREPASVNFVTCHDGMTLADLVAYDRKHNGANLEENRDGHEPNHARSFGVEGPSDDPIVRARRDTARRALVLTLAFARGVPLLLHGDELGRTQRGNNNAWCHDGPLTWVEWDGADTAFLAFVRRALAFRPLVTPRAEDDVHVTLAPSPFAGPGLVAHVPGRSAFLANPGGAALALPVPRETESGQWALAVASWEDGGDEVAVEGETLVVPPGAAAVLRWIGA
ncbi:MAG: alpha-amylase family glycosyl hydrolase [Gemmatimonadales bacterium]|nr:alpha-amylase family glycosyl hydrolase [Gemmatimonadales bacterium]